MTRTLTVAVAALGAVCSVQAADLPPAPPRNLVVADVPQDQGKALTISFNKSLDDGLGRKDVQYYDVMQKRDGDPRYHRLTRVTAKGTNTYKVLDPTVVPRVLFDYQVLAHDAIQYSTPLEGQGTAIDNLKPRPPGSLTVSDHPGDQGSALDIVIGKSPDDGAGADDVKQYLLYRQTGVTALARIAKIAATGAATYRYTDRGFKPGTTHSYQVRASDGSNELDPVSGSGTTVDNLAPAPPTAVTVTDVPNDNGGALAVSFHASADDGNGTKDVASYDVTRQKGSDAAVPLKTVTATGAATYKFTDATVANQTTYTYRVRAFDGANYSSSASGSGQASDNTPPAPPTAFKVVVTAAQAGGVDITFKASVDDVPAHPEVTRYEIFRTQGATPWPTDPSLTVTANRSATYSAHQSGLTVGQSYSYKARATAATGASEFTAVVTLTATDNRKPAPPRTLTAWDRPDDEGSAVYVKFSRSVDDGAGLNIVRSYVVYRKLTSVFETPVTRVASLVAKAALTYQILDADTALTNLRSYTYWAVAVSGTGVKSDDSNTANVVPQDNIILAPPTNLTAKDHKGDSGVIELSWTRSTSEGGIGPPPPPPFSVKGSGDQGQQAVSGTYDVFRRQVGKDWGATPTFTVPTSVTGDPIVVLDRGLTNGVSYQYRVRFRVDTVISPFSNVASAAPSASGSPSASAAGEGSLTVAIVEAPASAAVGAPLAVKVHVTGQGASRVCLKWALGGAGVWQRTGEMASNGAYDANFALVPVAKPGDEVHLMAFAADATMEAQSKEVVVGIAR